MGNLKIEGTKYTPEIIADKEKGTLSLIGYSYPENATEFYQPIFDWIENNMKEGMKQLEINFTIEYFNTSSSKCFLILSEMLEEYSQQKKNVHVNWYYKENDEDILESGEELFREMDIKHSFIPIKE